MNRCREAICFPAFLRGFYGNGLETQSVNTIIDIYFCDGGIHMRRNTMSLGRVAAVVLCLLCAGALVTALCPAASARASA